MKSPTYLVLLSLLCFASACQKDDQPKQIPCTGDCLFTVQDGNGTIVKMTCFNRFGILTDDPNTPALDTIYGIPDQMPARFEEVGKAVRFSGAFRVNTLTPQFPDPSIGLDDLYQMKLEEISEKN
ncbi:MAG: hypothetical protein K9J37_17235 [Saprospiraceae bacterium]|nr:hypothetical protein [Saprospiraceae bacterium]MCF8251661.1 hypothetical protein [Saprospiraceae bacterium]MCF8281071.1 hypothetical protein [Bacteroidales bacterium]MCF8313280.1 hypothetical protein [Saprospiraceae bacterium]MCF8442024.1 hypothetical protein [Saprospiraceae bacterium]